MQERKNSKMDGNDLSLDQRNIHTKQSKTRELPIQLYFVDWLN